MKKIFPIIFPVVILCSCSHYYYVANVQNVPLFTGKSEYRLSGAYSFGDEAKCIELQAAHSLSDRIGIMANYMYAIGGDVSEKDYGSGGYFDGAIGYYKPVSEHGIFEIYGGLGLSSQHHEYTGLGYSPGSPLYDVYEGHSRLSFSKLFLQPAFGLKYDIFEIAVSTRVCNLSYYNIHDHITRNDYHHELLTALSDKSYFFLEPAITARAGWNRIKVQLQVQYIGDPLNSNLDFEEEIHFSAGLFYSIPSNMK